MKILNLYAGIGGNRKLWGDEHEITAVEINPKIAAVYKELFPNDKVIVADAHEYLLRHYDKFDFIWSSPPCQSHSQTNTFLHPQGIRRYPDMSLWQEIIFLKQWSKVPFVIENVKPYYAELFNPQKVGRHRLWANFPIPNIKLPIDVGTFNRQASKEKQNAIKKTQIERNAVNPELGLYVFKCAFNEVQKVLKGAEQND